MSALVYSASLAAFISRFQLQLPQDRQRTQHIQSAAVLVPIICHPEPTLLLTRRALSLRKHAGQVAFPGGKTDAEDGSALITALREAQEEVAIPIEKVQILGQLAPLDSNTGFRVTPIIGLIPADTKFHANIDEVAEIFEIPLSEALALSRYYPLDIHRNGSRHRIYLSWYQNQFIWGLTATILRRLAAQVRV